MTKPNSAAGSTSFLVAAIGIYVAYFLHGASVIALAQNMSALAEKFATDSAGIAYLISGIGLGRLVSSPSFSLVHSQTSLAAAR